MTYTLALNARLLRLGHVRAELLRFRWSLPN